MTFPEEIRWLQGLASSAAKAILAAWKTPGVEATIYWRNREERDILFSEVKNVLHVVEALDILKSARQFVNGHWVLELTNGSAIRFEEETSG